MTYAIDFETYYDKDYSLTNMSPWDYVHDRRFDAYLVSVHGENLDYVGPPGEFDWKKLAGADIVAHNMAFDGLVLRRLIELGKVPDFERREFCTADLAVYLAYPRNLKGLMEHRYGVHMSKAVRTNMLGKTLLDTLADGTYADLVKYAGDDARSCYRFWMDDGHLWPEWEREASRLNREACWYGVRIDRKTVEESLDKLVKLRDAAERLLPWVNPEDPDEKPEKPGSLPSLSRFLRNNGITPPTTYKKDSPEMVELEKSTRDHPVVGPVIQARLDHASLTPHIARLETMLKSSDDNGILRFSLKYYGAHTGRNSSGAEDEDGAKGKVSIFNPLNLPKEPVFGVDLRGTLIPREGCKFVNFDFGQIEARTILWLAGHHKMLDQMRRAGGNIYIAYAILIGWAKPEDVDTDEKLRAWKHSDKYALIKSVVLAHGFGMGHRKFRDQTEAKSHGKTKLTYDEAKGLTDQWREANRPVCQFWRRMGDDFMRAVVLKQDEYSVKLPSGRVKRYFNPKTKVVFRKVKDEETGVETSEARVQMFAALTHGSSDFPLWGGILAQHVTQSTARDIMTQAAVEVCREHPGWPWLWSCYDEVTFEVPDGEVELACREIPRILCDGVVARTWACGLPLTVEGGPLDRYGK